MRKSCETGRRNAPRSAEQGFTLLEILVALAVFSLAAMALIRLQGITVRTAADLDGKAMSRIVANNLMVELQTDPDPPSMGESEGDVENGGRNWHWTRTVAKTDDMRLSRIDLTVSGAGPAGAASQTLTFLRDSQ
ncbi:type II secretion system minor pseudopilin GspI [Sphingobium sp. H39-3-25]|uniref:type II secretion system minor pseudopilin GspI n=1 Tax=Sphingobium arseniciresistens TaxID=3030834 RepID=UPI0023B923D5|nr:type II secretion system minor pseudopilin GspI [Sphingobium arseniciresistens]